MTDVDEELEGALHARDGALKSDPILSLSINNIVATLHVARAIQGASREQTAATLLAALLDREISRRGGPLTTGERERVAHAVALTDALRAALEGGGA